MKNYSLNKNKLVFSYIDFHTWNFFLLGNRTKFIDFEDFSFSVPRFDLANYIIESEYIFVGEIYPFYIHELNKTSEDFLLKAFKDYVMILKRESDEDFIEIKLDEIYRLFCLALIKTVVEYVLMVPDNVYLKTELDLIMLMGDRITRFNNYFSLIQK
jgi:thiamine kinase-like enzyme